MFSPSLSSRKALAAAFVCTLALSVSAFAQAPAGQGNPAGGGGRGNRANFQQQRMDRLKEALGDTDDEWKAIEPRITAVTDAQRALQTRGGGFGGPGGAAGGGRRNRGGQGGAAADAGATPAAAPATPDRTPSAVETAATALQTTLADKSATPDDIKAKLTALRDAKTAGKTTLVKAQDSLREILTARQEAVLVGFGMLE